MLFSKIIEKKFDAVLGRYDGDPAIRYPSAADFPELKSQTFNIEGEGHVTFMGSFYYYDQFRPEKLVVFDHGIGAGHEAYLREIEYLARNGYTVYSYDHTGCVSTGGTGILGFAQGISDLDHVLTALQQDPRFASVPRKIIGHSWGGYACMNVGALHPEVTHIVSLAGFLSAKALEEQYIPKPFLKYSVEVMERERQHNPKYADMDARDSLKKSSASLMHIQSKDDAEVRFDRSCELLEKALEGRANTEFVVLENRNHYPHRTDRAVAARAAMMQDLNQRKKKKQLSSESQREAFRKQYDWDVINQQDPEIWKKILDFLEK